MKSIYKYHLHQKIDIFIDMPIGAEIIHVHSQDGGIYLWAIIDTHVSMQTRHFTLIGTGNKIPDFSTKYLGTIHVDEYVWHIFEVL